MPVSPQLSALNSRHNLQLDNLSRQKMHEVKHSRRTRIPLIKLENQVLHIEESLSKITRWSKFKEKRKVVIDEYILHKKR